jgi:hypothetical protein
MPEKAKKLMLFLEEKRNIRIHPEKIWEIWINMYPMLKNSDHKKLHGFIMDRNISFKICSIIQNQQFTTDWKIGFFTKLSYTYKVLPNTIGSQLIYSVKVSGLFSLPIYFFLKKKLKANLIFSISEFIKNL